MDTEQIEVKGVSDGARLLGFLREVKEAHPGKTEMMIQAVEWVHDFPDIELLLSSASEQGLVDAFPRRELGQNEREEWNYWDVTLRPKLVKILKGRPREARRQTTIDGRRVDLRSERAHMILTPPIENLIPLVNIWIQELEIETDHKVRRAIALTLKRVQAYRGHELPAESRERILGALSSCTQEREVGNR
jgi:hypothetical protein